MEVKIPAREVQGQKKRSKRIRYISAAVVIALILIIVWLIQLQNAPATGTISQGKSTQSAHTPAPAHLIPYNDNPYVSYSYWSNYRVSSTTLESPNVLTRAEFLVNSPYQQLEVYTEKAPGGFSEESNISYRRVYKNLYTEEKATVDGTPALIFTRTDQGFERVTFVLKGNVITVVAFTTPAQGSSPIADYQKVVDSIHWKQ